MYERLQHIQYCVWHGVSICSQVNVCFCDLSINSGHCAEEGWYLNRPQTSRTMIKESGKIKFKLPLCPLKDMTYMWTKKYPFHENSSQGILMSLTLYGNRVLKVLATCPFWFFCFFKCSQRALMKNIYCFWKVNTLGSWHAPNVNLSMTLTDIYCDQFFCHFFLHMDVKYFIPFSVLSNIWTVQYLCFTELSRRSSLQI